MVFYGNLYGKTELPKICERLGLCSYSRMLRA
jgi:hypothetical protein